MNALWSSRASADSTATSEKPRSEPISYAYVYADTSPLEEEVDEWFMYNFWQWWDDEGDEAAKRRKEFVKSVLRSVKSTDRIARAEAVGAVVYLVLGRWTETVKEAGMLDSAVLDGKARSAATPEQLKAMKEGVEFVAECGGIEIVWEALRGLFDLFWADEMPQNVQMAAEELIHLMTIMYVAIQEALDDPDGMAEVRKKLLALNPSLISFMLQVTAKLRWDETGILPQTQILLLFWKSILLVFGGSKEIAETKEATSETRGCDEKGTITASPLDYHVFRQEITSKYPAYVPPKPLIPLEANQNTILPQLPNHPTRNNGSNGIIPAQPGQGREEFLKFERGYEADEDILDELDLSSLTLDEKEELGLIKSGDNSWKPSVPKPDYGPRAVDQETKARLDAVEDFYKEALPHLQSLTIVLLKQVVAISSNLASPAAANGPQGPGTRPAGQQNGMNGISKGEPSSPLDADVDELRSREIAAKAVTGTLILLLKWFKLSHVLKFEYLTQLLLDSNYLPMALKIFAIYDVQQVVENKTDRLEHSYGSPEAPATRPEVDELGYPINPVPTEPITDFSRRNFFSLINYLRIMQKLCKRKAHRNLLMVQYKSSNILRKALKVPQPELRLYTLKLFKNQVPYCGRKWRQSNMRVITAVYLHCRPELRDEWLAGSDVDAEVEEALPLEQALRSLTHWFHLRRYPERMAVGEGVEEAMREALREEQDFFI
ncbi:Factor arrest protein 11 [Collariella sp. IMI 366227]|nr:Factor arrest protein 11 [Collariella sp. IMI 366227]